VIRQAPQGIVLRTFMPYTQKILIFDVHRGKIQGVPQWKKKAGCIPHGALLYYEYKERLPLALLSNIELLQVPKGTYIADFYFLHHVLELCDYFLPFGQHMPEIFNLVLELYTCVTPLSVEAQRLFLYYFFTVVGVTPPYTASLIFKKKDGQTMHEFSQFLLECVHMHSSAHLLKTLFVIKKLTTH
jgi:hypothetical protein